MYTWIYALSIHSGYMIMKLSIIIRSINMMPILHVLCAQCQYNVVVIV